MRMICLTLAAVLAIVAEAGAAPAETVMITLHARPGADAALAAAIAKHYETARRLDLVSADAPHVTLRSRAAREVDFVDIFTWKDGDTPDNAPVEIQAIWREMNALVEPRAGRPGIDIVEMIPVAPR